MLTTVEFIEETRGVEIYFDKELNQEQRKIWYQELKNTDVARYRQIIRQVYRKCKFMPKLADIIGISEELPFRNSQSRANKGGLW